MEHPPKWPSHGRGMLGALLCGVALAPPLAEGDTEAPRMETAWLYGNVNKFAYYYIDLFIGSPKPQRTSVIVDTGSHLLGFPCTGCAHCGDHIFPAFDFSRSESAAWLNCSSHCYDECDDGHCHYEVKYSEGSSISGSWFTDVVRLAGPKGPGPPVQAQLGCHQREKKLFYTQRANGIMGLAPWFDHKALRRQTILDDLFKDRQHISTSVFSLCLSTWGGRLLVGGHEPSYHSAGEGDSASSRLTLPGSIQWLPMRPGEYYQVYPCGLKLGDMDVALGQAAFGITIVDSGTTFSSVPGLVYSTLVNDLKTHCSLNAGCGAVQEGDYCWRLRDMLRGPTSFPTLKMEFDGGITIDWPPHAYMHQNAADPGAWCYSFREDYSSVSTVLGISWMLHKDIIFDLEHSRLGVVHTICPERGRPGSLDEQVNMDSVATDGSWSPITRPAASRVPLAAATFTFSLVLFIALLRVAAVRWIFRTRLSGCHEQVPTIPVSEEDKERVGSL